MSMRGCFPRARRQTVNFDLIAGFCDSALPNPENPAMSTDFPNIFATVLARVIAANQALIAEGALPPLDLSRVLVEPPRDATHGDMATNAAMVLSKDAKKKPRELAELIAAKLRADELIEQV